MKLKHKAGMAAAVSLAVVVAGAGTAFAYTGTGTTNTTTPPWETGNTLFPSAPNYPNLDPNSKGGILFYDANGNQIAGGSSLSNIGTYLATTGTPARPNGTLANMLFAVPDHTKPTIQWTPIGATGSNAFPVAAPGPVLASTVPVATLNTSGGEGSIASIAGVITNDPTTGYDHILQVRVKDSGIGVPTTGLNSNNYYWSADIEYNNTTSAFTDGLAVGAWKVVYPAVVNQSTVTDAPIPSLASPQQYGTSVSFSTTVHVGTAGGTGVTAGTVQFFDGASQIGATKPVNGSGQATSDATTTLSIATHSITAVYTPAAGALFNGSTSGITSFQVTQAGAHNTTTGLVVGTASVTQPAPVTATATVTDTTASPNANVTAGSVVFHLDSAAGTILGTDSNGADGWTLSAPSGSIPAGSHTIYAVYSGTTNQSPSFDWNGSTSGPGSFTVITGAVSNTDVQNIETSIAAGTVTIVTDYSGTAKLVVPALQLNGTGTFFTNNVPFGHIQVNDQRPGNLGYDLFAQSSTLTRTAPAGPIASGTVGTIDSHNVGFTSVGQDLGWTSTADTSSSNVSYASDATVQAANAVQPGAAAGSGGLGDGAKIAHANHGYGNLVIKALLTINAPLNTYYGTYDGTITFTAYSA